MVDLEQTGTFAELTITWIGDNEDDGAVTAPVEEYQG
jgi:hypothetical protein